MKIKIVVLIAMMDKNYKMMEDAYVIKVRY
jgi:hypothetical protein